MEVWIGIILPIITTIIIDCRIFRVAHVNALRGDHQSSAKVVILIILDMLWSLILNLIY